MHLNKMDFVPTGKRIQSLSQCIGNCHIKIESIVEHQHTRRNPLTGQWILVCPHRMQRPWSGQEETPQKNDLPEFDASNPLCPGVVRSNGEVNYGHSRLIKKMKTIYSDSKIQNTNRHLFSPMIFQLYWKMYPHRHRMMIHFFKLVKLEVHAE